MSIFFFFFSLLLLLFLGSRYWLYGCMQDSTCYIYLAPSIFAYIYLFINVLDDIDHAIMEK